MVGIDISGFQPDDVPGQWDFIVVKSTEGMRVVNPRVDNQWANAARTTRGLYHYARPGISDGGSQATVFAADALARGFVPGQDMWQLDAEDGGNDGVGNWGQFIDQFMAVALVKLGARGFLYAGWPFVQAHGLQGHIQRYKWWLPAYGRNDGNVNPYAPGTPSNLVVIHQFTSAGGLDQNRIVDAVAYQASSVPPPPAPLPVKVKPMHKTYTASWNADCDCPTGGSWIVTLDGGVITVGSAPFHGSPIGIGAKLAPGEVFNEIRVPDHSLPGEPLQRLDGKPTSYVCVTSADHRFGF